MWDNSQPHHAVLHKQRFPGFRQGNEYTGDRILEDYAQRDDRDYEQERSDAIQQDEGEHGHVTAHWILGAILAALSLPRKIPFPRNRDRC